jgi:hypothetical protein
MIGLGIQDNIAQVAAKFDLMAQKQVPFATSLAINRCLQLGRAALLSAMQREFDRPTPYTLNSLYTKNSTKYDLSGWVGHKQANSGASASKYLQPEIEGGTRNMKSTEKFLGHYYVPSKYCKLDRYGNVPSATLTAIFRSLGSLEGSAKAYVLVEAGNPRKLPAGVYQRKDPTKRKGGALIPILFFTNRAPRYNQRYDVSGIIDRLVQAEFGKQFAAAMDYALGTATITL